jgi:hypothetical protein
MRRGKLLVLALLAAVAAGCGGERLSKADYEQKVRTVYAGVQQAFQATNVRHGLAERVGAAQDELRRAADELNSVEPPTAVEKQNEEIVEGLREYADDLDGLRKAAEQGDAARIRAFNEQLPRNEAVKQIAEAAEEMKFKGYDLGPIAEE